MVENTTYNRFIDRYIKRLPDDFKWQATPLQIYPLEFISNYLVLPTPLLQADYHFIVYLSEGRFNHQIGIENYDVKAPSVLYVPDGEVFSIRSTENGLAGFFILIENRVISPIIGQVELFDLMTIDAVINLETNDKQWLDTICNLLFQEVSSNNPNRKIGTGLLQAMLHKLIDFSGGKKTISRQHEIANNFKQLLNKHFKEHKSVQFYAEELGVSENYLNRCAKIRYNKNCKQIIQETVILKSQILMFNSNRDISEICFEVGLNDPSYFSRLFKKVTGQTPTEFKKQVIDGTS